MAIGHGRAELLNFWGDGMRRWIAGTLIAVLLLCFAQPSRVFGGEADADLGITAQACVLMEADTGQIIYEKNSICSLLFQLSIPIYAHSVFTDMHARA